MNIKQIIYVTYIKQIINLVNLLPGFCKKLFMECNYYLFFVVKGYYINIER